MVDILILVAVVAIVIIAGWYVLGQIEMPDPVRKIVTILIVVVIAILAVGILLSMRGGGGFRLGAMLPYLGIA